MPTESLYDELPAVAAQALRAALAAPTAAAPDIERHQYRNMKVTLVPGNATERRQRLDVAFTAVGFPASDQPIPLAASLTSAQRALAVLLADQVVGIGDFAIPKAAWVRRRWLGLAPPGALERPVTFALDGTPRTEPLWRALALLTAAPASRDDDPASDPRPALFSSLPLADQLEAYGDISLGAYGLEAERLSIDLDHIGVEGRDWAPGFADRMLELFDGDALHLERGEQTSMPDPVKRPLCLALVRAGVTFEPRWDVLLPIDVSVRGLPTTRALLAVLPESRRAPAIVRAMEDMFPKQAVRTALALLEDVPALELASAVLARADDIDGQPRRRILERLAAAGAANPAITALVAPELAALPPPLGLRLGALEAPGSADDLTAIQLAQCARGNEMIMGCSENWVADGDIECLQLGKILDAAGQHVYDFAVYMDEDGVFFRAGTDEPVAVLCQYSLDCPDAALKEGLQLVLADKPSRD